MTLISKRYLLMRTIQSVFLIWMAITGLFFLFKQLPGDYTTFMLYQGASQETVQAFREAWGLNEPLHVQYYRYMNNLLHGDAGTSIQYREPVFEYVRMKIFNSFILVAPGITFAYILGSVYGLIAGDQRGTWIEKYGMVIVILFGAFPSFFISIILVVIFSLWLGWLPTSGLVTPETYLSHSDANWYSVYFTKDFISHYILPFLAVVFRYLFIPSMIMRTSVVEVLGQDFLYYKKITGLPKLNRLLATAKHASLPVITLYPVSMTRALGGLVLIETVFNWPGIGYALVQSVLARDFPVMMFVFYLIAVFIILSNYLIDIIYGIIDPRVQIG